MKHPPSSAPSSSRRKSSARNRASSSDAKSGPGAPRGNTNAFKHGLYAKHYVPQSRHDLEGMPPLESLPEIYMLRAQLDDLLTLISNCGDEDRRIKLYNALFTGAHRLTAAMRTHTLLVGKDQELLNTFWEAVDLFRKERGL